MTDKILTFNFTVDEANILLEGMGHIPYARAYALVEKLQAQATSQINNSQQQQDSKINDDFSAVEQNSTIEHAVAAMTGQ